jgi:ketosteroid isomerase-like protein
VNRALAVAFLLFVAGCGGGDSKPLSDREAIAKLWKELSFASDYPAFCEHATRRFAAAAAYSGGARTCAKGVENKRGELPEGTLKRLRIAGVQATGSFREGTGALGHVRFAKQDGEWKLDGLTYFVSKPSFVAKPKPRATPPGKLHTTEGREIARVTREFYGALEDQDTVKLCEIVTPTIRARVLAIGGIQDAKTCPKAYEAIFDQLRFSYTTIPTVVRVTIAGDRAFAFSRVGRHKLKAPLRNIRRAWKVDTLG